MFRLFLTVVLTSTATFAWFVFNPGNASRNLLEKAALMATVKNNYELPPQQPAALPDIDPPGGGMDSVENPSGQDSTASLKGEIEILKTDTRELQELVDDLKAKRAKGENVSPSNILAITRQIDANKREIESLEKELARLQ